MKIKVNLDMSKLSGWVGSMEKQVRYATAVALTRTAQDVKTELKQEMRSVFDRPTGYTLSNKTFYVQRATKASLEASVGLNDRASRPHYLMPQIEGGSRRQKRFEELLRQAGVLGSTERAVPGIGAKLDASGNMGRGQIVQILSQLRAFNLAGASQNATGSARSKAKRASISYFYARKGNSRQGARSWMSGDKVQHLRTGVYAKTSRGTIVPVLIFVKSTSYSPRLNLQRVGQRVVDARFRGHFNREFEIAKRSAR